MFVSVCVCVVQKLLSDVTLRQPCWRSGALQREALCFHLVHWFITTLSITPPVLVQRYISQHSVSRFDWLVLPAVYLTRQVTVCKTAKHKTQRWLKWNESAVNTETVTVQNEKQTKKKMWERKCEYWATADNVDLMIKWVKTRVWIFILDIYKHTWRRFQMFLCRFQLKQVFKAKPQSFLCEHRAVTGDK